MMATKERPIHFPPSHADEIIQAILDGRRTMMRWPLEPQPFKGVASVDLQPASDTWLGITAGEVPLQSWLCPYGAVGDRLWVQETWGASVYADLPYIHYRANDAMKCFVHYSGHEGQVTSWALDRVQAKSPWRASIHLPRWASRITLTITEVRVERVQKISNKDAIREGVEPVTPGQLTAASLSPSVYGFHLFWDSLNAKRGVGWDANPWVWVNGFTKEVR